MRSLLRLLQVLTFCWTAYTIVQVAQGKCITCSSFDNNDCIANVSAIEAKWCEAWCFTRVHENGTVERGCMEQNATQDLEAKALCAEPNCFYCDASVKVCNKHTICKSCDAGKDAACAQTDASNDAYNSVCPKADTGCVAKVRAADSLVERRCAADGDVAGDLTMLCSGSNCNAGIYPAQRRRCYQCEADSKCANLAANTDIAAKPCLLYDANEQCYTYGSSDTNMARGCRSDASKQADGACSGATPTDACATCSTDNCNARPYKRDQKLLCVQCQVDDATAMTTTTVTTLSPSTASPKVVAATTDDCTQAKNCQTQLLYTQDDACYNQTLNGVTHRGCVHDRDAAQLGACDDANACTVCSSADGCNKDTAATTFTCIRCRSDVNADCRDKATAMTGSGCTNDVADPSTALCYYGTWNEVLIRGCLVDADPRMQRTCNDTKTDQCVTCPGANCNTKAVGGANALALTTPLAVVLLLCGAAISRWQT